MHKLFIHIGAGKCGSTAIQGFLGNNSAKLKDNGILVPGVDLSLDGKATGNQIWFLQNLMNEPLPDAQAIIRNRFRDIHAYMNESTLHTLVLSAENLSNPNGFEQLFEGLEKLFDVKIVFYIRRQDDFLLSAWKQWGVKVTDSFDTWVANDTFFVSKCLWGDWAGYLQPWENMFGRDNIILRRFDRNKLIDGDVVKDFAKSCGLYSEDLTMSKSIPNRSFNDSVTRLVHDANDLFEGIHDNRLYKMFRRFGGEGVLKTQKASSLISLERRLDILATYEAGNERLMRDYFGDEEGPLFEPPAEKDVHPMTDEQITDQKIACLTRTLFGMYRHLTQLEKNN